MAALICHTAQLKSRNRTTKRILIILVLAAVLFGIVAWPVYSGVKERAALRDTLHRAKTIALACKMYAADHSGKYPEHLADLVPSYLPDSRFIVIPSRDGKRHLDFEYFGGSDTDPPQGLLLRVPPDRPDGAEILVYSDTSAEIRTKRNR